LRNYKKETVITPTTTTTTVKPSVLAAAEPASKKLTEQGGLYTVGINNIISSTKPVYKSVASVQPSAKGLYSTSTSLGGGWTKTKTLKY
jgi:hypothetical protein